MVPDSALTGIRRRAISFSSGPRTAATMQNSLAPVATGPERRRRYSRPVPLLPRCSRVTSL